MHTHAHTVSVYILMIPSKWIAMSIFFIFITLLLLLLLVGSVTVASLFTLCASQYLFSRAQLIYFEMYLFDVASVVVFICLNISYESVCRVFIQSTCSLLTYTHWRSRCLLRHSIVLPQAHVCGAAVIITHERTHICVDVAAAVVAVAITATPCYHASYLNTVIGVQSVWMRSDRTCNYVNGDTLTLTHMRILIRTRSHVSDRLVNVPSYVKHICNIHFDSVYPIPYRMIWSSVLKFALEAKGKQKTNHIDCQRFWPFFSTPAVCLPIYRMIFRSIWMRQPIFSPTCIASHSFEYIGSVSGTKSFVDTKTPNRNQPLTHSHALFILEQQQKHYSPSKWGVYRLCLSWYVLHVPIVVAAAAATAALTAVFIAKSTLRLFRRLVFFVLISSYSKILCDKHN